MASFVAPRHQRTPSSKSKLKDARVSIALRIDNTLPLVENADSEAIEEAYTLIISMAMRDKTGNIDEAAYRLVEFRRIKGKCSQSKKYSWVTLDYVNSKCCDVIIIRDDYDDDNEIAGASTKASGGSFDGVFGFELAWRADALNQRANSLEQWLQSPKKQAKIAFAMSKGKFTYPSLAARSLEGFHLATVLTQDCGRQGGKKPCSNINCSQCGFCGNTHAVTSKMDEESKQKLCQLEGVN
ncbi:hypothetical protein Tco_0019952 [Tanacetum coccineum]